ncbi:phosphate starvation-inducible protein PhoH [Desulfurobacterium pacificum]|uniref:PhoH-like protein n=1 Tax=Desulfurobacterium pacificum TaxID=240166 RepID=A0ABY1NT78_9BACT|nr:PhoH family protein [Desulfurobacterium pacificum]SMP17506.1 phosphate starvation-inducible protein PhoH [Desulfurobacterium pacificum]
MIKVILELSPEDFYTIVGHHEENLKKIAKILNINLGSRGNEIMINGSAEGEEKAKEFFKGLETLIKSGHKITKSDMDMYITQLSSREKVEIEANKEIVKTFRGKKILPKTPTQKRYVQAIEKNDIVFGVGPAGTGKTYLAVAVAVSYFRKGKVNRLILTRPAVEAGEKLGFLPGTLQEKIDPYLKPLYDALFEMMEPEKVNALLERNVFEIAPLAYMRGRTLNDAFIILDEAQNTTKEQMKMFLTRLGFGSKVVITGDITQIDLPSKERSGLVEALKILKGIDGIEIVEFTRQDVVRHRLVQEIIKAYEEYEAGTKG